LAYAEEKGREGFPDTTTLAHLPKPILIAAPILTTLIARAMDAHTRGGNRCIWNNFYVSF